MIYCVMVSEEYGDGSLLSAVFKSKKRAEKYCEIQNQLEEGYSYWINEQEFYDKKVSMKTKIGKYYNYYIDFDFLELPNDLTAFIKECDENNEAWEMTENQKYSYKNYVEITSNCINGWSMVSYEKARAITLNEFYRLTDRKHKARTYKVLIGNFNNQYLKENNYPFYACAECGEVKLKEHFNEDFICDNCRNKYLPYDTTICPICGGKIKHPYTGQVTDEQLQEDIDTCQLIEVIDENDNTLGYHAICKRRKNDKET